MARLGLERFSVGSEPFARSARLLDGENSRSGWLDSRVKNEAQGYQKLTKN